MDSNKVKILAIDDNRDNLIILKALIGEAFPDAGILIALNGEAGLEIAVAEDPDVILLDIVMPGMDGFEVCQRLKADPKISDIPVVFVTALKGDRQSRIRALDCGAEAFLAKPIDEIELTAQIRAMVKIKNANRKKRDEKQRLETLVKERTIELIKNHNATLKLLDDLKKENEARRKSEVALSESEEKYRTIFDNVQDVFYQTDLSGIVLNISPSIKHFTDFDRKDIIGKPVETIYYNPSDRALLLDSIRRKGELRDYELNLKTKTGELKIVSVNARLISGTDDMVSHIDGSIRDITKRKRAEEELLKEQQLMTTLIDSLPGIFYLYSYPELKLLRWNKNHETVLGLEHEDMKNRDLLDNHLPESKTMVLAAIEDVMRNNQSRVEAPLVTKDKHTIPFILTGVKLELLGAKYMMGVGIDISDLKRTEQELIKAKEKAEESERLKSAFLANMSHEIRTPMNGILGFAGLLKEPDLTGEEQKEYIRIIEKSGVRMLNIINDIISISKVESGQMNVSMTETNIVEQLEYIHTFFKPEAEQKGLQLLFENPRPAKDLIIKTDREKVYAILTNLVKNAIKFTTSGFIEIGFTVKDDFIEYFVKDSGSGIPKEQKKVIFERFRQGSEKLTRDYEGAGLGLSISKAYVEMLGGQIWVESEPGIGSAFYFSIPKNSERDAQTIDYVPSVSDEKNHLKNLKVLIAEDDKSSEILISIALKMFCKEILKAKNGIEAVEICRNNPDLDLILMDIKLPLLDGYEAVRQIRKNNKEVVIIAQTAFALAGDREKSIAAGFNDYISKPINQSILIDVIKKHLK